MHLQSSVPGTHVAGIATGGPVDEIRSVFAATAVKPASYRPEEYGAGLIDTLTAVISVTDESPADGLSGQQAGCQASSVSSQSLSLWLSLVGLALLRRRRRMESTGRDPVSSATT